MTLLEVKQLKTYYRMRTGTLKAVDDVSFNLEKGESLGIAGESGCGKSTVALSLMRLVTGAGRMEGQMLLDGLSLMDIPAREYNRIRLERIALISQAAMGGLNPVYTVGKQIAEPLIVRKKMAPAAALKKAAQLLSLVEIDPSRAKSYPHELSGGMRQRVMIAMSLVLSPDIIIADEPTTALDVITQATILKLLNRLRNELGLSVIFISHDLSILAQTCDRIMIMYAGKIVETGLADIIFNRPFHPYTKALINSFPDISGRRTKLASLPGSVPDLFDESFGCSFYSRCQMADGACRHNTPQLTRLSENHSAACFLPV